MTVAFTVINTPYFPYAKTLADSFISVHEDIPFYICVFDDGLDFEEWPQYNFISYKSLHASQFLSMRDRYDNMSLSCALKPFFADFILSSFKVKNVIYFDSDIYVFKSVSSIIPILDKEVSIILTPHVNQNVEGDDEVLRNMVIRKFGLFNAGFFVVKNDNRGRAFLDWWKRMLFEKCIYDMENGISHDQTWLDLVAVYFSDALFMLRDNAFNVAFWNLKERNLCCHDDILFLENGKDVVFYHFARFDYYNFGTGAQLEYIYGSPFRFKDFVAIELLYRFYKDKLKQNGYETFIKRKEVVQRSKIYLLRMQVKNKLIQLIDRI